MTIPPEEIVVCVGPAIHSISEFISVISSIKTESLFLFGSEEYSPFISDNSTNKSALHICATRAASLSLSPNLISSVDTVSFSLITGITFKSRSFISVALAFKCFRLVSVSSGASKI